MAVVIVNHSIAEWDAWKAVYDSDADRRASFGCTGTMVFRSPENENNVTILLEFDTMDNAHACAQDPALKEAMGQAGVTSEPSFSFLNFAMETDK
jgi:hypothetical protein